MKILAKMKRIRISYVNPMLEPVNETTIMFFMYVSHISVGVATPKYFNEEGHKMIDFVSLIKREKPTLLAFSDEVTKSKYRN
jgi:hypothetical protein